MHAWNIKFTVINVRGSCLIRENHEHLYPRNIPSIRYYCMYCHRNYHSVTSLILTQHHTTIINIRTHTHAHTHTRTHTHTHSHTLMPYSQDNTPHTLTHCFLVNNRHCLFFYPAASCEELNHDVLALTVVSSTPHTHTHTHIHPHTHTHALQSRQHTHTHTHTHARVGSFKSLISA